MAETNQAEKHGAEASSRNADLGRSPARKPYGKPAFEREQVFETMALACGKLSPTQQQCRFNRKSS